MAQPPSSNGNCSDDVVLDSDEAGRGATAQTAPALHNDILPPLTSSPPLHLLGGMRVMEPNRVFDCTTIPLSPPIISSPTCPPMDEESDETPPPPEMKAASFEVQATKPELTDDDIGATDPEAQIAVPFEGHVHEEVTQWEGEDDLAPRPLEMVAASFEGHGYEEEKREEGEEDLAPSPPKMVAASFEGHGYEG